MELWTEYEGRTIDGVFPLAKLLQPEGRSAFFSTPNGSGTPTVIRLIESHFDDEEILARWREVAALNHPNLVKLKKFGKVELDGTPLVYAVMEPAEANLGEIVGERRLTVAETTEVAASLVAALGALHGHGLVHEHVEPGNVLAVGEVIKLRSDCVREAPAGDEGVESKRRDVRDLSAVLLRALTQQRTLDDAARELPLPVPFEQIVRNGTSGAWGLAEIGAALALETSPQTVSPTVERVAAIRSAERVSAASDVAVSSPVARAERFAEQAAEPDAGMWIGLKIGLALSVLVLVLVAWHLFHSRSAAQNSAAQNVSVPAAVAPEQAAVPSQTNVPAQATVTPQPAGALDAPVGAASVPVANAGSDGRVPWRVIAFTYNHEDQAKAKAARVAEKHPELQPEVFTPSGRAPYLVSVGGVMGRDEAVALARKARHEGVARDVYAQNYKGGAVLPAQE